MKAFYFRLFVYSVGIPILVVTFLTPSSPRLTLAFMSGTSVFVVILLLLHPKSRSILRRARERSRSAATLDLLIWNALVIVFVGEMLLFGLDKIVDHPFLTMANADSRERIENHRLAPQMMLGPGLPTNSLGYLDTEWEIPKPENTFRIVALGDSFAVGVVGYDLNVLTILERLLSTDEKQVVEVANFGINGTAPVDYLRILIDEGLELEPDLVVVCLFTGNDFIRHRLGRWWDWRSWRVFGIADRIVRLAIEKRRMAGVRSPVEKPAAPPPDPMERAPLPVEEEPCFSVNAYDRMVKSYIPVLRVRPTPATEQVFAYTFAILEQIVQAAGCPTVIAVFPNEFQVNPELREEFYRKNEVKEEEIDLSRPARLIQDHFEEKGVPVIDLLPTLGRGEKEGRTYCPRNTHWNSRGNLLVAEQLARELAPLIRNLARED